MSQPIIQIDYGKGLVSFTESAIAQKVAALESTALIARVASPDDQEIAVAGQKMLRGVLKLFEDARKACKAPVIELGRKIDQTAKDAVADIEAEEIRVAKLIGDFQQLELAKVRAAEAARLMEERRIQLEREAEERKAREAAEAIRRQLDEEARKAREAAAKARNEQERQEAARLAEEAERQRKLAEAESLAKMDAIQQSFNDAAASLPVVEQSKADGQIVKEEWVVDGIREFELMKARPDLVRKIEFDLVGIKSELARGLKLPGVTAHKEVKSTVRASRKQLVNV